MRVSRAQVSGLGHRSTTLIARGTPTDASTLSSASASGFASSHDPVSAPPAPRREERAGDAGGEGFGGAGGIGGAGVGAGCVAMPTASAPAAAVTTTGALGKRPRITCLEGSAAPSWRPVSPAHSLSCGADAADGASFFGPPPPLARRHVDGPSDGDCRGGEAAAWDEREIDDDDDERGRDGDGRDGGGPDDDERSERLSDLSLCDVTLRGMNIAGRVVADRGGTTTLLGCRLSERAAARVAPRSTLILRHCVIEAASSQTKKLIAVGKHATLRMHDCRVVLTQVPPPPPGRRTIRLSHLTIIITTTTTTILTTTITTTITTTTITTTAATTTTITTIIITIIIIVIIEEEQQQHS